MYGKMMRVADEHLLAYLDLATALPAEQVAALKKRLSGSAANPMDVKKEIAFHLVELYHGREAAERGALHFRTVVQEKAAPEEITEVMIPGELAARAEAGGVPWPDLLVLLEIASSKGEVRRLIQQGGFYVEQEAVRDIAARYTGGEVLVRLGKRRYYRVIG
jgi:tyrosyl-tRNA synthetase